ncbi:MAG: hypothetical protein K1X75_12070 [Leptospirales bacterium]|nr:hypothetical protein [Leptospirales bacterium]
MIACQKRILFSAAAFFAALSCDASSGESLLPFLVPPPTRYLFTRPEEEASDVQRNAARDQLLHWIDGAEREIELRSFGLDETEILAALQRAADRGVELHIVGDRQIDHSALIARRLPLELRDRSGLQHIKLALIDRRLLFVGTGNFTRSDFFYSYNGFIATAIDPQSAAQILDALRETNGSPLQVPIPGGRMLFAPRGGALIQFLLAEAIASAGQDIRLLQFAHSDRALSAALQEAAARGVRLDLIYDDEGNDGQLPDDAQGALINAGLGLSASVVRLEGARRLLAIDGVQHGGHLHHKTLLIDDQRVLSGSYNWSVAARDQNAEVLLDLVDPLAVQAFAAEFRRIADRSRTLPRPPFAPPAPEEDALECAADEVCAPPGALQMASGGGSGPWRAICVLPLENGRASRRCLAASLGALPELVGLQAAEWIAALPGGVVRRHRGALSLPCIRAADCKAAPLLASGASSGWIWLSPEAPRYVALQFLGAHTISEWEAPLSQNDGLLRFSAKSGDLIVFLRRADGAIDVGALRSGVAVDPDLLLWSQLLPLSGGPSLQWLPDQG